MKKSQPFPSVKDLARQLRADVDGIAFEYGRRVGKAGHDEAEAFLLERLEDIGYCPYRGGSLRLPYTSGKKAFVNLIGKIPGNDGAGKAPLLIGAHYDSAIDAPCADDNAAAVAITLAVAQAAQDSGVLERDLVVALFDAEEPPYFQSRQMGSNYFVRHQMLETGVHAAIIMDLVGHDVSLTLDSLQSGSGLLGRALGALPKGVGKADIGIPFMKNLVFITGAESHAELAGILDCADQPKELKLLPTQNSYVGDMSDHGAFRLRGVPYFFLSCGRWPHYHTPTDTPDRLNYTKMAAIARLVFSLLEGTDDSPLAERSGRPVEANTVELEITYLREVFGAALPLIFKCCGLERLETREDIDRLADGLMEMGL